RSAATGASVEPLHDADDEPARATRQRRLVDGLDEQMHVVALHREVNHLEGAVLLMREPRDDAADHAEDEIAAEGRRASARAERDVRGQSLRVRGPLAVRDARRPPTLSARAGASPAP